jgi:cell division protein FtsX
MLATIFGTISDVVAEYTLVITSVFEGLVEIFYDSTGNALTLLGTLALIAVGVGIVAWAFGLVKSLFRMR